MGISEQPAVGLHRHCRVMVKEEINRIVIAADVQADSVAAMAGARRLLARHQGVIVPQVVPVFSEGILGEVITGKIAHLQQVGDMDILGAEQAVYGGIGVPGTFNMDMGITGVPALFRHIDPALQRHLHPGVPMRNDLDFLCMDTKLRTPADHELVTTRRYLRLVLAVDVERVPFPGRPELEPAPYRHLPGTVP